VGTFQFGDLYFGSASPMRTPIVLLHGGFWRPHRSLEMTARPAQDLGQRGRTVWNVEYRRNGQGDWPATLEDCGAAIDHLAGLGDEFGFDGSRALVVGHSAGGQLAVWSAGRRAEALREERPPPRVDVRDAISLAGVLDLDGAARSGVGDGAVAEFVGGNPEQRPDRYAAADPMQRLPTGARVRCLHSRDDERVPFDQSARYVDAARRCGDDAELIEVVGSHVDMIDIRSPAWAAVVVTIESLTA
jgi:acetyl esterase/lipase